MHVIQTLTGVTTKKSIEIRKPFSHLLIVKTGNTNGIVNERITATIKGLANEAAIITNLKIADVALLSQFGSGYLLRQVLSGGNIKSVYHLELSSNGGLLFSGQSEHCVIDLDNLESGATYDLFAVENLTASRSYVKYQTELVQGTEPTQRVFSLGSNAVMFAVKDNNALSKVTLTGNNGAQVTYTPEELRAMGRQLNGVAVGPDVLIEGDAINQTVNGGAVDFFFIPALNYRSAEVYTTGGTELQVIRTNIFGY